MDNILMYKYITSRTTTLVFTHMSVIFRIIKDTLYDLYAFGLSWLNAKRNLYKFYHTIKPKKSNISETNFVSPHLNNFWVPKGKKHILGDPKSKVLIGKEERERTAQIRIDIFKSYKKLIYFMYFLRLYLKLNNLTHFFFILATCRHFTP